MDCEGAVLEKWMDIETFPARKEDSGICCRFLCCCCFLAALSIDSDPRLKG